MFVRYVGLPRQRSGAEEESICYDEERGRERGSEKEVEMAADAAKQRGLTLLNHLPHNAAFLPQKITPQSTFCTEVKK